MAFEQKHRKKYHPHHLHHRESPFAKEMRIHETLFEKLADPTFLHSVGPDGSLGKVYFSNDAASDRYGFTREEFLEMTPLDLDKPGQPQEGRAKLVNILLTDGIVRFETTHITKSGEQIAVEVNASKVDIQGKHYALSICRDITQHKQTEAFVELAIQSLKRSGDDYRNMVELSLDMIAVYQDGKVAFINKSGASMLGYDTADEITERPIADFISATNIDMSMEDIHGLKEKQNTASPIYEQQLVRKNGEVFYVERREIPIIYQGKPAVLIVIHDITKRKASEKVLKDADQKKEKSIDELEAMLLKLLSEAIGHETEQHSKRTVDDMILMTKLYFESHPDDEEVREIMQDPNYLVSIERGARLHDFGKISVPKDILNKPDKLTPEERTIMETHTTKAIELLGNVPELKLALNIPFSHHEKWDGTGYPRGFVGKEIPLIARMFTVVDV